MDVTVQDLLRDDLLKDDDGNETVEVLSFIRDNDVSVSPEQLRALLILKMCDLDDVCNFLINSRRIMTLGNRYQKTIEKMTLADRIKGNAKLSQVLRSSPNPALALQRDDSK